MLFTGKKYLQHFLQRRISLLLSLMFFSTAGYSQITLLQKDTLLTPLVSPVIVSIHKKPAQLMILHINPPYKPFVLRKGGELMHWPNYPLNAAQIIARETEWQRRNNQTIDEQIASDIIKNRVNTLIYLRKTAPAVIPKF